MKSDKTYSTILPYWKTWAYKYMNHAPIAGDIEELSKMLIDDYPSDRDTPLPVMFEFFCAGFYAGNHYNSLFERLRRIWHGFIYGPER